MGSIFFGEVKIMPERMHRRELLSRSVMVAASASALSGSRTAHADAPSASPPAQRRFKLGMVTYMLAADWDLSTILERCKALDIAAIEFRTTHKHGVEPSLNKEQRDKVKKRCADGNLVIWGLGTTCDFHSPDAAEL